VGKIAIIVVASTTVGVSDFTHPTSLVGLSCRWHWHRLQRRPGARVGITTVTQAGSDWPSW